ncbi:malate dehydrogenase [Blastomyces gilchristii SLH14081]|uniref:Malate dehydrogenase n=1 Tax=Blastomyces gilchristii (strain SLH14081) TaxID=559298 RepID=A0A179UUT8_BLAGS|nr:malate dehydrogenase [Blastomyces gilchristii SLH14081]OAT10989.1 malate dehydrogenase [Blastomyces gilchristii SLH14081]
MPLKIQQSTQSNAWSVGMSVPDSSYYNKGTAFPDDERQTFKLHGLLPSNVQTLDERGRESSRTFRPPEGCFLNIRDQDRIDECLANLANFGASGEEIDCIVITDGERGLMILGIGDQGDQGEQRDLDFPGQAGPHGAMGTRQLPVVLDCGISVKNALSGRNTMNFVDKFVKAARKSEDFPLPNAQRTGDDIQGTGCVTLAALLAALQVSKVKLTDDVPVVCFGAGPAVRRDDGIRGWGGLGTLKSVRKVR